MARSSASASPRILDGARLIDLGEEPARPTGRILAELGTGAETRGACTDGYSGEYQHQNALKPIRRASNPRRFPRVWPSRQCSCIGVVSPRSQERCTRLNAIVPNTSEPLGFLLWRAASSPRFGSVSSFSGPNNPSLSDGSQSPSLEEDSDQGTEDDRDGDGEQAM
jgi:hypothetical protein